MLRLMSKVIQSTAMDGKETGMTSYLMSLLGTGYYRNSDGTVNNQVLFLSPSFFEMGRSPYRLAADK